MMPKIVSLVPSEIATTPSRTRPVPTRLQGLSPDQATTRAGGRLYLRRQYGASVPTTVQDSASGGSLVARFGAVARSASGDHCFDARSMRFMPEPSPGSMAT